MNITIIYTSPLVRAYNTAKIIGDTIGIKDKDVIVEQVLTERDFGIFTGMLSTNISKITDRIVLGDKVNYILEVEGGEDFPVLYDRAKRVLDKIQERHYNENILLVTHGDISIMILAAYYGWTWEEGLRAPYLDNADVLELKP